MVPVGSGRRVGNLPAEVTSFVGRRREVAEVKRVLSSARHVTLTGVGGVGKTRLALRVAADLRRRFPDGVWLVELAPVEDSELLVPTVADTLGVPDQSARPPLAAVTDYLRDRRLLLVLDNCEHLLRASAALADALLRSCPGVRLLATSRQPLGIDGEFVLPVPPLSLPDPDRVTGPEALMRYEAVNMFVERAVSALPDFRFDETNAAAVARICERLDGIPLAIELAAVRLRVLSVEQVLERLDNRYRLLTGGSRTAMPRQQTLRALIDWSFGLCSERERTLWRRLSVFVGGFGLEAARAVCSDEEIPFETLQDLVTGLVDKSILLYEQVDSEVRYRMLDTIREYGRNRLAESGEESSLRRRHRDWYERLIAQAGEEWFGPGQVEWLARLRLEHANIRAALDYCLTEPGEAQVGLRMASTLWFFWFAGMLGEGRHWLDRALETESGSPAERALGLCVNSYLAIAQGDLEAAMPPLEESRRLARDVDDPTITAWVTEVAGMAAMFQGDLPGAIGILEEALDRHRSIDDHRGVVDDLFYLSAAACLNGDADRAVALCEESLAICEAFGERWCRAYTLWVLSLTAWRQGDPKRAGATARDSLALMRDFNDRLGVALCLEVLAWTAVADRKHERAACLFGAIRELWRALGASLFWSLPEYHEQCAAHARRAVGENAFREAFRAGAELGFDKAVAYALKTRADAAPARSAAELSPLTRRETQVAELVAQGLSNKEIATKLVISQRTAEAHVENILSKLGFTSRAQVAAWLADQRAASAHPG